MPIVKIKFDDKMKDLDNPVLNSITIKMEGLKGNDKIEELVKIK